MQTNLLDVIELFNKKSNKNFDSLFFTDTTFYNKVTRLSFINKNVNDFVNELLAYTKENA